MNTPATSESNSAPIHRTKRSRVQRAADLLFIESHAIRGRTQSEIADLLAAVRPYRVGRSQIGYDLDELKKRWIAASVASFSEVKAKALRELDAVLTEAWESWTMSKADGSPGNPAFTKQILDVHDRRAKLLGLHAPERHEISGPAGAPIEIESREVQMPLDDAAKKALFARYMAHLAEDQKNGAGHVEPESQRN